MEAESLKPEQSIVDSNSEQSASLVKVAKASVRDGESLRLNSVNRKRF